MADNVEITAGAGTVVATDQVGTDHYQKVKLVDGTAESTAVIPGDATGGLYVQAVGKAAHDAAVSGNPVRVAGKSLANGSAVTAVSASGDVVDLLADPGGIQYVAVHHPNHWTAYAAYTGAQTNATLKAAPGASLSLYITDIIISNGATAGTISILDGSGGTVLFKGYFAIDRGMVITLRTPIKLTANTLLAVTSVTCTTHTITVNGFIAA